MLYPVGLHVAVGYGSGEKLPLRYARLLDGCGGMLVAHGVTLKSDLSDLSDPSDKMGASRYTPRVCGTAVWFGSGEELPLGYARQLDSNGGMLSARV